MRTPNWEWPWRVRVPLQGVVLLGMASHGVAMGCQRIAPCGASDSSQVRKVGLGRLLLGQTVERSQPPDDLATVNRDNFSGRKRRS